MPEAAAATPPEQATAAPTPPVTAETVAGRAPDHSFTEGSYSEEVWLRKPKQERTEAPPKEEAKEPPAPTPPGEEKPEGEEAPPPATTEPRLTAEQVAELSDEEYTDYLEKHPKSKERLERLRQNWKGTTEQEIARRVEARVKETQQQERAADEAYAKYAKLAEEKPEVWEAMTTPGNPAYNDKVVTFVTQYEAWASRRGAAEPVQQTKVEVEKLTETLLTQWNEDGWKAVKATLQSDIPYWDKLPADFRKAVEEDKVQGDKGWWQATVAGLAKAMDSYYKAQVKEAREAGRNEARLSNNDEGPVTPDSMNGKPVEDMSDREILNAWAMHGSRAVPRETYRAAARRLKLEY